MKDLVSKLLELQRYILTLEGDVTGAYMNESKNFNGDYIKWEEMLEVIVKYAERPDEMKEPLKNLDSKNLNSKNLNSVDSTNSAKNIE